MMRSEQVWETDMRTTILAALATLAAGGAWADYRVDMNRIDVRGVGAPIGTIAVTEDAGGVRLTPDLKGLPPGTHGFHVHQFANCGARERNGAVVAGDLAGDHWDPEHHGHHGAPGGQGHRGDLPVLTVGADGSARQPITVKGVKLSELRNKSFVIHAGGDNQSDEPKPNGGGGDRIACGVVQAGEKP
jgi:Cu-Zn family superoxide dismutase